MRFVNRQPGSGTRLCFDALLAAERLQPAQINGYRHEEFTHAAVAAMIASGTAQAAFGIEAAAAQQHLSFVPLVSERYFLAMRAATASDTAAGALLQALASRWFRKLISDLPGYSLPGHAEPMTLQQALEPLIMADDTTPKSDVLAATVVPGRATISATGAMLPRGAPGRARFQGGLKQ